MTALTASEQLVIEQEERTNREVQQLFKDIRRIGEAGSCKFGPLFDDEQVANYYEALVGTLKTAKKRGLIDFKGQMLFKGMSDNVVITISKEGEAVEKAGGAGTPVKVKTPSAPVSPPVKKEDPPKPKEPEPEQPSDEEKEKEIQEANPEEPAAVEEPQTKEEPPKEVSDDENDKEEPEQEQPEESSAPEAEGDASESSSDEE